MASTGLRDIPITNIQDENLDVTPYIESLSQFIMECDTPMTIAIQGDWGSGKTSMMNLIKANIEERYPNKICPIWFNTWQYSQFNAQAQLGISLLTRFASEVSGQSDASDRVKKMLGTVVKSVVRNMAFVGTMALTGSAEGAKDAQEAVDDVFQKDFVHSLTELKDTIVKMTQERLERDKKDRVVVFIDDLDRLAPERAVELLEVFKLFLDVPGCVFILACDYQVIAQGLQKKFGISETDLKGKSFFDKIIQLPFSMPISQYDTRRYTSDLLTKIGITAAGEELEKYRCLIGASVGLNPRSMKRLFNAFLLINLAAEKKGILKDTGVAKREERLRILLACLCMQTAFEPVYRHLAGFGRELTVHSLNALQRFDMTEPGDFQQLLEDMGGVKSAMAQRLPDFMDAFMDAIQLVSDGDDNLVESELQNLIEIFSFSSITATTALIRQQDGGERDSQLLKDTLRRLIKEINDEYKNELDILKDELKAQVISRKGKIHGYVSTISGFLVERKRVHFMCEIKDRDTPPWVRAYLSSSQFSWLCALLEQEVGKAASYQGNDKIDQVEQIYYVGYQEFAGDESLEEKLNFFENMVRTSLATVIPKLADLKKR